MEPLFIDPDIRKAHTLPAEFYRDPAWFERSKKAIWEKSWHYAVDAAAMPTPATVYPFTLLEGALGEPLLFSRDARGQVHCLSNVCTHRGKILVESPGPQKLIRCGYHGRCFSLDGGFRSMPGFEGAENFPGPADNLPLIPFREWMGMFFASLHPDFDFEEWIRPVMDRVGWMPLHSLRFTEKGSRDYLVNAHWALYCDNYLEGFHIPFVHPALNAALSMEHYDYELFPRASLQLGIAKTGEPCFEIPPGAPDAGKRIYAWYFFLFPNLMLNFYPWGLSMNVVEPLGHDKTLVRFRTYLFEGVEADRSVNQIEQTELEDEAVVESVQKGLQSRYYDKGRYSPEQERAVHHFHRLIAATLGSFPVAPDQ